MDANCKGRAASVQKGLTLSLGDVMKHRKLENSINRYNK